MQTCLPYSLPYSSKCKASYKQARDCCTKMQLQHRLKNHKKEAHKKSKTWPQNESSNLHLTKRGKEGFGRRKEAKVSDLRSESWYVNDMKKRTGPGHITCQNKTSYKYWLVCINSTLSKCGHWLLPSTKIKPKYRYMSFQSLKYVCVQFIFKICDSLFELIN